MKLIRFVTENIENIEKKLTMKMSKTFNEKHSHQSHELN